MGAQNTICDRIFASAKRRVRLPTLQATASIDHNSIRNMLPWDVFRSDFLGTH